MNMRDDLKAFIDNEVSEEKRTRILKETENNPELQAELIELRQISRVIQEEAWQPQPVGLERTLMALESGRKKRPWWLAPSFGWACGAACTVLLVIVLFPVFAQSKHSAKQREFDGVALNMPMEGGTASSPAAGEANISQDYDQSATSSRPEDAKMAAPPAPLVEAKDKATLEARAYRSEAQDKAMQKGGMSTNAPASTFAQPRYQIKTANLSVEVANVPDAQQEAESIAKALDGRVENSQKSNDEGHLSSAELTLRIPVANFETAVRRIRKMGRVINDGLSTDDVTADVVDTQARLRVLRAEEDQYVELLKETKKIGEVLSVKEKLSQVRQNIESMDARYKALTAQAAESTIHLSLTEKPSPNRPQQNPSWSEDAWANAVSALSTVGRALGSVAVFLFVFSPVWLPVVLIGWWAARRR